MIVRLIFRIVFILSVITNIWLLIAASNLHSTETRDESVTRSDAGTPVAASHNLSLSRQASRGQRPSMRTDTILIPKALVSFIFKGGILRSDGKLKNDIVDSFQLTTRDQELLRQGLLSLRELVRDEELGRTEVTRISNGGTRAILSTSPAMPPLLNSRLGDILQELDIPNNHILFAALWEDPYLLPIDSTIEVEWAPDPENVWEYRVNSIGPEGEVREISRSDKPTGRYGHLASPPQQNE